MTDPQPYGRTPWDFAADAVKSKTMVYLVLAVCLVVPALVHFQAEPGTEISLFAGLIKYQKAKSVAPAAPELVKVVPPSTKDYAFPQTQPFEKEPTAVLDGTINLGRPADSKDGHFYLSGANIDIVSFAIRTPQGDALKPKVVRNRAIVDQYDALIELEYKGNFFLVETVSQRGDEGQFVLSVKKLEVPTMKLRRLSEHMSGG